MTEFKDRLNLFNSLMEDIVPDADELNKLDSKLLQRGFFTAPASSTHHGNYEGGLFDHSARVARNLLRLTKNNDLQWQNERSPILIGMFHDLCKIDNYEPIYDNEYSYAKSNKTECRAVIKEYRYNKDTFLTGHGDKSVMMLSEYFKLTEEEIMCIRYHMGAFVDREEWQFYTRAIYKYPNVLWTHTADMLASHVEGV